MPIRSFAFCCILIPIIGFGKVVDIHIKDSLTVMGPLTTWGKAGQYQFISGEITFGIDPDNQSNQAICDLHLAPVNKQGLIEAKTNFIVLQAVEKGKRNGTALIEVSNRGGMSLMRYYNRASTGKVRANVPPDYGDGYLLAQGYTLIWIGWQWDVPKDPGLLRLDVPTIKDKDGTPITGLVRSDWVMDAKNHVLNLGHRTMTGYPVANDLRNNNTLTYRLAPWTNRIKVPNEEWGFASIRDEMVVADSTHLYSKNGFEEGRIYECVYEARNPVLAGYGLAAIRDIASYVKYEKTCPFPVKRTIAQGISQTGRFLRHFLYQGFNKDERGRYAYDGMLIYMAGAGRGSFNHRFAQPSHDAHRYSSFDYPTDLFPFSTSAVEDPITHEIKTLRDTLDPVKLFFINTGYEYWGRAASLLHTDLTGHDLLLNQNERYFHIAGMQHYGEALPDSSRKVYIEYDLFKGTPIDPLPYFKALLVQLNNWISIDQKPINNKIPTFKEHTLITSDQYKLPYIPGLDRPSSPYIPTRLYFGVRWESDHVIDQEPPIQGTSYSVYVPAIDTNANEIGGIRPIELRVPLATYTPWSLRHHLSNHLEMDDFRGTFVPFAKNINRRTITHDMRSSLTQLYESKKDYMVRIDRELDHLIKERLLLSEDKTLVKKHAEDIWNWVIKYYHL